MSTEQQRTAAAILGDLLALGIRDGLPALDWTVAEYGTSLTGRSHHRSGQDRVAVLAWASALGLMAAEHQHPSGMTTVIAHADRMETDRGPCSITVVADIYAEDDGK
jgi:hypothetical protein